MRKTPSPAFGRETVTGPCGEHAAAFCTAQARHPQVRRTPTWLTEKHATKNGTQYRSSDYGSQQNALNRAEIHELLEPS